MKNRPGSNNLLTDWEDEIHFDADDPDFCNAPPPPPPSTAQTSGNALTAANAPTIVVGDSGEGLPSFTFKVPSNMSLASVHGPQFADFCSPLGRNSISMSSSLSDLVGSPLEISAENVLTIEELRTHMGSCFTCGVSWTDDHVSLDCAECGGYSMEHPCPLCDGKCGVQWKRDFTMSHACGKARWQGVCPSFPEATMHLNSQLSVAGADTMSMTAAATSSNNNNNNSNNSNTTQATCAAASNQLRLAQELCARLEQLSASTHI